MPPTTVNGKVRSCSFSIPEDVMDRLRTRLPVYGDRSKVVVQLLELFLQNKVVVKIPERKF